MRKILTINFSLTLATAFFLSISITKAQTFTPPDNYKLKKPADYAAYEKNLKECLAWYIKAPLDSAADTHKKVRAFIKDWVNGSPNVTVTFGTSTFSFMQDKPMWSANACMIAYMAGVAVFEINNPAEKDEVKLETAGFEAILEMYKNNMELMKNSDGAKKIKKLKDDGQLEKWIADNQDKDKSGK